MRTALLLRVALMCVVWAVTGRAASAETLWMVYTPITPVDIITPTPMVRGAGINEEVQFTCSECYDDDCVCEGIFGGWIVWDDVTYTWSATGGTFPQGQTGTSVLWKAPAVAGDYTVTVTVNDVDGHKWPDYLGSDDDYYSPSASLTMEVIRLDAVHLYFYNHGTGYPYKDDDSFDTRAVVTITYPAGVQYDYCAWDFDPQLTWWWAAGSEGPQSDNVVPPQTPAYLGVPADYPSQWPFVDITWDLMWHYGSDALGGGHARRYWYERDPNGYPCAPWGEDSRTYLWAGVHRLRATATIETGMPWQQPATSPDEEYALRICTKRHITGAADPQRNSYVEWISTYENIPYEWGGEGFGGKDSNGAYAGAPGSYDGYGMDCSGLVSCGAYRAGYNWSSWRVNTTGLLNGYYTTGVSYANFDEGDILVKSGVHVVSCSYRDPGDPNQIKIIEACADDDVNKVWMRNSTMEAWSSQGYIRRRLVDH